MGTSGWPRRRGLTCSVLILVSSGCVSAQWTATVYNGKPVADKEVLIRLRNSDAAALARVQAAAPTETIQRISTALPIHRVRSTARNIDALVQTFAAQPDVAYVEPNYVVRALATTPNDTHYSLLWGMTTIGAPSAWDLTRGSSSIVVGVIDTGIDYTHPDLAPNVWNAPTSFQVTIGGRTITCPAGSHGFNAITSTCDPKDDRNHGTHVSGTIGAVGNNSLGVAGVNWNVKLLGLKFLDSTGSGTTSDAINAIEFALQAKAIFATTGTPLNLRVFSNSWGGDGFSQALLDEINKANTNDVLFVVAAGNSGVDVQVAPTYPASYTAPNMVSVAATDSNDKLAYFSNYGASAIHLAAPGVNILSTVAGPEYGYLSGTSMSTPHVSGAAALTLAACPGLNTAGVKKALLSTVDTVSALFGKLQSGGRLNVDKAVRYCPTAVSQGPVSLFASATPAQFTANTSDIEAGMKFRTDVGGTVSKIRFYKAAGDTTAHTGSLWTANGIRLATVAFPVGSTGGWQEAALPAPVTISANTTYVVSYFSANGYYGDTSYFLGQGADNGPLHALKDGVDGPNGVVRTGDGSGFPSATARATNYWVDLVFTPAAPQPSSLVILGGTPQSATIGATFASTLQVKAIDSFSNPVSGVNVTFTAPTSGASAAFSTGNTITVTTGPSGIAISPSLTANNITGTYSVTASVPGLTPVSFSLTNTPAPVQTGDTTLFSTAPDGSFYFDSSVELGVKFRSDVDGTVKGIRFYKNFADSGPHTGSLWTSTGILLATGIFTNETSSGWQQLTFTAPASISAGTTYIASYHTSSGFYASRFYFLQSKDVAPLHGLRSGVDGPNGVFQYGSGILFPSLSYQDSNYWVDVLFSAGAAVVTPQPQSVTATGGTPQSTTVGTSFGAALQARVVDTSSNPMQGISVTFSAPTSGAGATFNGAASVTVTTNSSGIAVSPVPVANATAGAFTVTASVTGLTPANFSLTNTAVVVPPASDKTIFPSTAPSSTFFVDGSVELGVKFRSDASGVIKGIRFFKNSADTGPHSGSLWSSSGALLASGAFTNETASGWQQLTFATPVTISANTTYVASYHTSTGFYASRFYFQSQGLDNAPLHALKSGVDGPNAVFQYGSGIAFPTQTYADSNYWVDVVFAAGSTPQPQTVAAVAGTPQSATVSTSFGAALQARVTDAGANPLSGISVTFTAPSSGAGATFNGASSVTVTTNSSGIAISPVPVANSASGAYSVTAAVTGLTPATFSLTNTAAVTPPADKTIFSSAAPNASFYVDGSVELGVKFRSDTSGYIKGIRFYKNSADTGQHSGSLWNSSGTLLATGTFTNETASGWQQLTFTTPVAIAANTTYIASYHTGSGFYAGRNYFTSQGADNAPLHALKSGIDGPNCVFQYGSAIAFPTQTYQDSNYWVDVVFSAQ